MQQHSRLRTVLRRLVLSVPEHVIRATVVVVKLHREEVGRVRANREVVVPPVVAREDRHDIVLMVVITVARWII